MTTKIAAPVLVGGPLLGKRSLYTTHKNVCSPELKSWSTFEPIITPFVGGTQQFVLLPSASFVAVLAYKTGRRVATLIPYTKNEEKRDGGMIESACLATFPAIAREETVDDALSKLGEDNAAEDEQEEDSCLLLVGCRDGTIREFDLSVLTSKQQKGAASASMSCGHFVVSGPCHLPRRVVSVTKNQAIKHLTAPTGVVLKNADVLLYALVEKSTAKQKGKPKPSSVNYNLLQVRLPSLDRKHPHDKDKVLSLNDEKIRIVVQETLSCIVGHDKERKFHNTLPFRLLSLSRTALRTYTEQDTDRDVLVVIAVSSKIQIYHNRITSGEMQAEKMQSMTFPMHRYDRLSALSIAPNGTDITCGFMEGEISIMSDAIPQSLEYFTCIAQCTKPPPHPSTTVLTRRVHWHAQPVTSIAYQGLSGQATVEPMLYSGGFESVLVTWQLSRGTYRPADVLPRLGNGGILHICCADQQGGILVYCEDNSLQLFAAHNSKCQWKVQGLASLTGDSLGNSSKRVEPTIRADFVSGSPNTLILSGLPGAPGHLHWYDTRAQRVTLQLEVAPFNRVSRTEHDDSPMPVPSVTNCVFSESGRDLVTVDTMPTENSGIGAIERMPNGSAIGVVSTVRFWSWNPMDRKKNPRAGPLSLTAAMTYPHGEENRVSAIAISNDGQYVCTVSNDDRAFRLWHKVLSENSDARDADSTSRRTSVWICRFKVTTPSGYSNLRTGSNAVDFSADGSILAICYGSMITLWDHKKATLLTALQHLEGDRAPVESLSFVKSGFLNDMMLTRSRTGVALQSPYGKGRESWSYALPPSYKDASVSHVELISSHDLVAVCMTFHKKSTSQIFLLDAATGALHMAAGQDDELEPMTWELPEPIRSIGAQGRATSSSNWVDVDSLRRESSAKNVSPIKLYATMSNGDMVLLSSDEAAYSVDRGDVDHSTDAPRLNMLKRGDGRKRMREDAGDDINEPLKKRPGGSGIFGVLSSGDSAPLPSSELPALGESFTRAFVSRNLLSNRE